MSTHTHVDATMLASTRSDVGKRLNISALIRSILILFLGAGALCGTFMLHDPSSATGMALLVAGIALLIYGVVCLLAKSRRLVYLPDGSAIKSYSFYFDLRHLESLRKLIEEKDFARTTAIKSTHSGNIRMDVLLSGCNGFAAAQLFQFIPYNYQPVSETTCMTDNEARQFSSFVSDLQNNVDHSLKNS
jgi:hypothetical protein